MACGRADAWLWQPTDYRRAWTPRFTCGCSPAASVRALFAWRCFSFSWMLAVQVWVWSQQAPPNAGYHLSYLTNDSMWLNISYYLTAIILSVDAFSSVKAKQPSGDDGDPQSRIYAKLARLHAHRMASVLLGIAVSWETVVVILYWALLFPASNPGSGEARDRFFFQNIVIHGTVVLHPWIDVACGSLRLQDRTILPVLSAAVVYLFMNLGVSKTIRPPYPILKWERGSDAILVLGTLLAIVVFYYLAAGVGAFCEARARAAACAYHKGSEGAGASFLANSQSASAHASSSTGCDKAEDGAASANSTSSAAAAAPQLSDMARLHLAASDPFCEDRPLIDGGVQWPCASCACRQ